MSKLQRTGAILLGLLMVAAAVLIFALPGTENGLLIILLILGFMFAASGVKDRIRFCSTP